MTDTPHDVLVIGSGAAGLTAALALAETKKVLVLAKGRLDSGSTAWAQGGIAAVLDAGDISTTTSATRWLPARGSTTAKRSNS